ncbi:MAG TPA: 50S ribosomal protein L25 [Gaiellaceae bacterium]|nr:50S ribosomal protein L25 [Gaiellaceae bacterium]
MAGERTKLVVAQRERLGTAETKRLRKQGFVPGVLYGNGEPVAICVQERELRRALTGSAGLHAILDVEIDGKGATHASILKEYQVDPVRGGVTHVDLQEVRLDQTIHASVAVHLVGGEDAPGVREGGVLSQPLREVTVEALPLEVPEHIEVDVSGMEIGGTLRISDLRAPEGSTLLDDPEMVVATITAPTKEVVPEPTEEELAALEAEAAEGEEGEEGAEGEGEAAEGTAGEPAEGPADAAGDQDTAEG